MAQILVVDDEKKMGILIEGTLKDAGYSAYRTHQFAGPVTQTGEFTVIRQSTLDIDNKILKLP